MRRGGRHCSCSCRGADGRRIRLEGAARIIGIIGSVIVRRNLDDEKVEDWRRFISRCKQGKQTVCVGVSPILYIYTSIMASIRLRRAFRYPEDSGDENEREELDEEGLFSVGSLTSPISANKRPQSKKV